MDIVQERLEREYDMDLITTAPSVVYEVLLRDGSVVSVENPSKMPDPAKIEEIREPIVDVTIFVPQEYVGAGDHAVHRQARRADRHHLPRPARDPEVRTAAGRDRARFLRQAEVGVARLRLDGLRVQGVPRRRRRQGRHADQRRPKVDALSVIVHRANATTAAAR
jgi:hypothetical protein